jgi:DNA-binding protein
MIVIRWYDQQVRVKAKPAYNFVIAMLVQHSIHVLMNVRATKEAARLPNVRIHAKACDRFALQMRVS